MEGSAVESQGIGGGIREIESGAGVNGDIPCAEGGGGAGGEVGSVDEEVAGPVGVGVREDNGGRAVEGDIGGASEGTEEREVAVGGVVSDGGGEAKLMGAERRSLALLRAEVMVREALPEEVLEGEVAGAGGEGVGEGESEGEVAEGDGGVEGDGSRP